MKIGFIGVGNMGGPMCRNIITKSNHDVTVFDLGKDAVKRCTDLGAKAAASVAELAAGSEVIMTSLPMPKDVEAVVLGPGGIAENAKPGTIYFDLSTNAPEMVRRLAETLKAKGITMLDAPVSGGTVGAEAGTIAIMVGGDAKVFEANLPLLRSFAGNPIHMGEIGMGTVAKLINNMVAFCNAAAASEGLILGMLAGIDAEKLNKVISTSSGNSAVFTNLGARALSHDFTASFALDLAHKDLHLALELADAVGAPVPAASATHNLMRMARGMGFGKDDSSSVLRVYETVLGRKIGG